MHINVSCAYHNCILCKHFFALILRVLGSYFFHFGRFSVVVVIVFVQCPWEQMFCPIKYSDRALEQTEDLCLPVTVWQRCSLERGHGGYDHALVLNKSLVSRFCTVWTWSIVSWFRQVKKAVTLIQGWWDESAQNVCLHKACEIALKKWYPS